MHYLFSLTLNLDEIKIKKQRVTKQRVPFLVQTIRTK